MRTPEEQAAYIAHLESEIAKFQTKIGELEIEITRLKKEKGLTREDLSFNDHTGLYSDASGRLYCPTCVGDDKRNPLMVDKYVWRCTVGGHSFPNPDAPFPIVNARPPRGGGGRGGGNDWMGN